MHPTMQRIEKPFQHMHTVRWTEALFSRLASTLTVWRDNAEENVCNNKRYPKYSDAFTHAEKKANYIVFGLPAEVKHCSYVPFSRSFWMFQCIVWVSSSHLVTVVSRHTRVCEMNQDAGRAAWSLSRWLTLKTALHSCPLCHSPLDG